MASLLLRKPCVLRPALWGREVNCHNGYGIQDREFAPASACPPSPDTLLIVKVSKRSFQDVVSLLERTQRPTRLTFVRHACGRRFRTRRECRSSSHASRRRQAPHSSVLRRRGSGSGSGLGAKLRKRLRIFSGLGAPSSYREGKRVLYIAKRSRVRAPVAPASSPSPKKLRKRGPRVEVRKKANTIRYFVCFEG